MAVEPAVVEPILGLRAESVAWRAVDGEVIVLDLRQSSYLGINPTGAVVWQALSTGASRRQLVAAVCDQFDVDEQRAAVGIDAFLAELGDRGFLSQAEPG